MTRRLCTKLDNIEDEHGQISAGCRLEEGHAGCHFLATRCPCGGLIVGNAWAKLEGRSWHVLCAAQKMQDALDKQEPEPQDVAHAPPESGLPKAAAPLPRERLSSDSTYEFQESRPGYPEPHRPPAYEAWDMRKAGGG